MKNKDSLRLYVAAVYLVSYIWYWVIFLNGGIESGLVVFVMLFPGLVALILRLLNREGISNVGWGLKKWWYALPAVFVPVALIVAIMAILLASGQASLTGFTFNDRMLVEARFTLMLGKQAQSIPFFALNLFASYLWFCLTGCIITLGEEFGWQGYLNQKLLSRYGLNRGLLLLGIIWGYWHLPLILMGYNFPNYPVLGALLLMPISTVFLGIFQAWLYLRSGSIWMPALLHASGNAAAGLLFGGMAMRQDELLAALLWIAGWGIAALLALIALNRRQPQLWQIAGEPAAGASFQQQEPVLQA